MDDARGVGETDGLAPRSRFDAEVHEKVVGAAALDDVVVEIRAGQGVRFLDARLEDGEAGREIVAWSAAELEAHRGLFADIMEDFGRASGTDW